MSPLVLFACGCGVQKQNLPVTATIEPDAGEGIVVIGVEPQMRVEIRKGFITSTGEWDCRRAPRVAWVWSENSYLVLRLPELPEKEAYGISKLQDKSGNDFVALKDTQVAVFDVHAGKASYVGSVRVRAALHTFALEAGVPDPATEEPDSFAIRDLSRSLEDMLPEIFDDDSLSRDGDIPGSSTVEHFAGRSLQPYSDWPRVQMWIAGAYPGLINDLEMTELKMCPAHRNCGRTSLSAPAGAYALVYSLPTLMPMDFYQPTIPIRIPVQ